MFLAWLLHASRLDRPRLPVLLTLHGKHPRRERTLDGWPGYADSAPVRVGNGAADQHQLDGYGWVLDAAWLLTEARPPAQLRDLAGGARLRRSSRERWREPDAGIWEIRGDPQHHVHSKLMAWLALDRALAHRRHPPVSHRRRRALAHRARAIAEKFGTAGFDADTARYTRSYGSDELDAARPGASPTRRRADGFADECATPSTPSRRDLDAGGPLLYRYPPGGDGLPGTEGAFLPCAFWLVQALAETGRIAEATAQVRRARSSSRRRSGSTPRRWIRSATSTSATFPRRSRTPRSSKPRSPSGMAPLRHEREALTRRVPFDVSRGDLRSLL